MRAYYNEIDPFAAQWLRNLIAAGYIADGDVDTRSIEDVRPMELAGYTQCHFFAGIGVWSYALREAGWSDDRPVWTASCPCQPFSAAGEGAGIDDPRHLWPAFNWLLRCAKPRSVPIFGEQVASKDGLAWLDIVQADLEGSHHTCGAVDMCAAGVGAPHRRQRLYFMGYATSERYNGRDGHAHGGAAPQPEGLRTVGELAHALPAGRPERWTFTRNGQTAGGSFASSAPGFVGDANNAGSQRWGLHGAIDGGNRGGSVAIGAPSFTNGFWHAADWLPCIDGKARPVEPGSFPLATGIAGRVGRLRAYGNALNAETAIAFIEASMEIL